MIDPELQNIANEITNETRIGANTAQKIGALFSSLIEKILPVDDIAQSAGTSTSKVMSQAAVRTFVYAIRDAILKGSGFNLDSIQFNPATETLLTNIGQLRWNADNQTLEIKCSNDVTLSIGQENYIRGKNAEATQILNGKVVYVSGGQGANSLIKRASNNNTTGERVIGVATQNIDPNNIGFITTNGIVNEINTSAFAEGDVLWLGVDGALTNVKPGTDVNQICIGVVLRSHATQGSLLVSVKDDWRDQVAQLRSDLSVKGNLIPANFTVDGYYEVSSSTKLLIESTTYSSLSITVNEGDYFECSFKLGGNRLAGVIFFDENGNNVGFVSQGDNSEHFNVPIAIPYGKQIVEMIYCSNKTWSENKIQKYDKISKKIEEIEINFNTFKEKNGIAIDQVFKSPIENGVPLTSERLGYFDKSKSLYDGEIVSSTYGNILLDVNPGDCYKATSKVASTPAVFVFFDENGNNMGFSFSPEIGTTFQYIDVIAEVPIGVSKMIYQYQKGSPHQLSIINYQYGKEITEIKYHQDIIDAELSDLKNINKKIIQVGGINLYNGNKIPGYINTTGLFVSTDDGGSYVTDLIPVFPNTYYYLSYRKESSRTIRCLDENGNNPSKVLAAATGGTYTNYYMPNLTGEAPVYNGMFKTSPTAHYLQFNLKYNDIGLQGYEKVLLEYVGTDYDESFIPSEYEEYTEEILIKETAIPTNILNSKDIKILCFGNSFTQDSMSYVPFILKNIDSKIKITLGIAYIGGSPLAQHLANFTGNDQTVNGVTYTPSNYDYYKCVNSSTWSSPTTMNVDSVLSDEKWDIVTFQQSGSTSYQDWDIYYAPFIFKIHRLLYDKIDYNINIGWILTQGAYSTTDEGLASHWLGTANNSKKIIEQTGTTVLFPFGTAVQNLRTTSLKNLGDGVAHNLLADTGHLQEGIGCLCAAYANSLVILRFLGLNKSIMGENTRVDQSYITTYNIPGPNLGTSGVIGITDANCYLAQVAAEAAIKNPYILTDISSCEI